MHLYLSTPRITLQWQAYTLMASLDIVSNLGDFAFRKEVRKISTFYLSYGIPIGMAFTMTVLPQCSINILFLSTLQPRLLWQQSRKLIQ